MATVDEARAALAGKDVAERAAAARELAAIGDWDDVEHLLSTAMDDKSPSVRIYTAAAATRIVLRTRGRGEVGSAEERQILDALRRFDPQRNPSLLMALGALGTAKARSRLGRLLRDPHSDVRMAAAAAVRRAALSEVALGDEALPADVASWLASRKTPPDARAELVRLVGEAGWSSLEQEARQAVAAGPGLSEVASEALKRLAARREPEAWTGLWLHAGGDVLDEDPDAASGWLLITEARAHDGERARPVRLEDGLLHLEGLGRARRLWAPRVKQDGVFEAVQLPTATYWRSSDKQLAKDVEAHIDAIGAFPEGCAQLASVLADIDGAVAPRARALCLWKAGQTDAAAAALDELLGGKKPKADLLWWRANVALGAGALDDARRFVDQFLDKAPKKAHRRPEAEALKSSLTR